MSNDLWVEHDDYGPSKPQRKVGRHEKPVTALDDGSLPVARVKDAGIDTDPHVTHGTGGGGDDILRLRMGEQAVADAAIAFQEIASRQTFEKGYVMHVNEELDNSLEVDPYLDEDPVGREVEDVLDDGLDDDE